MFAFVFDLYLKVFANITKYTLYMFYQQKAKLCLTSSDWLKSQERIFVTPVVGSTVGRQH